MYLTIFSAAFCSFGQIEDNSGITNSTESAIDIAKNNFDNGHYLRVFPGIRPQIASFNKQEKIEAYQLFARTFIELDQADSAHKYIYNIIEQDPLYTPSEDIVQQDYIQYFKSFNTRPLLSMTFGMGVNKGIIINQEINYIYQGKDYNENSKGETGQQYFILLDLYISKKISIQSGTVLSTYNYSKNYFFEESYQSSYLEKLQYFELPILIKYLIPFQKEKFFICMKVGPNISFLGRATSEIKISDATKTILDENTIFNKNAYNENSFISGVESSNNREKVLYDILGGLEIGYKINRSIYGFELVYISSLSSTTKKASFFPSNEDQPFYYYHRDNQFKINKLKFSFFYRYNLKYHTRPKLKNV